MILFKILKKIKNVIKLMVFILTIISAVVVYKAMKTDSTIATLYKEEGTVLYKYRENDEYLELKTETIDLPNLSYIKTEEGYAHLILADNSMISLDQNTEIQVDVKNNINIKQSLGKTWHRINEMQNETEYKVETSDTLATVRGTTFAVDAKEETEIYVLESVVEVVNLKQKKEHRKPIQLQAKEHITRKEKELIKKKLTEKTKDSNWYKRNKKLGNELKNKNYRKKLKPILKSDKFREFRLKKKDLKNEIKLDLSKDIMIMSSGSEYCETLNNKDKSTLKKTFKKFNDSNLSEYLDYAYSACENGHISEEEFKEAEKIIFEN